MKNLNLELSNENKAHYLKIADAIRLSIRKEQLKPGEKVPSTRKLAVALQCHRHTVMNALNELVAEGVLISNERSGYQVCHDLPKLYLDLPNQNPVSGSGFPAHQWNIARTTQLKEETFVGSQLFKGGVPDTALFPMQEFKTHISDALRYADNQLLEYGNAQGHPSLLEALETYLRRFRALVGKKILITHGSQEAIFLCGQILIEKGDKVAVETLGYPPAWEALRAAGAQLVPIEQDQEGIDPDSLEKMIRKHRIKLIYLTPLHQFPTTVTLSIPRRMKIYEIAARIGIPILEDDYDHEFHYRCQSLAPLASNDPAQLVIYLSTFSKIMFPSVRIGFMAVPERLLPAISKFRRIMNHQNESLMQDAVARWMASGGFERHLRKMSHVYENRRDIMVNSLNEASPDENLIDFRIPDGGMTIWLNTRKNANQVAEKAMQEGIHVFSESQFRLDQKAGTHLRIGFSSHKPDEIQSGILRLLCAIKNI